MQVPVILVVERALRDAGIPIDGVSIGDQNDRTTWRAFYQAVATAPQRAQGDALIASVDTQDATIVAEIKADFALSEANQDIAFALGQALWEAIPSPLTTLLQ